MKQCHFLILLLVFACKPRGSELAGDTASSYKIMLEEPFSFNPLNMQSFYDQYAQSLIYEPLAIVAQDGFIPKLAKSIRTTNDCQSPITTIELSDEHRYWPKYNFRGLSTNNEGIELQIAITNIDVAFSYLLYTHYGIYTEKKVKDAIYSNADSKKLAANFQMIGRLFEQSLPRPLSFTFTGYKKLEIIWDTPKNCRLFHESVKTIPVVPEHVFGMFDDGRQLLPELSSISCYYNNRNSVNTITQPFCETVVERLANRSSDRIESSQQKAISPKPNKGQSVSMSLEVDQLVSIKDSFTNSSNYPGFVARLSQIAEIGAFGSAPFSVTSQELPEAKWIFWNSNRMRTHYQSYIYRGGARYSVLSVKRDRLACSDPTLCDHETKPSLYLMSRQPQRHLASIGPDSELNVHRDNDLVISRSVIEPVPEGHTIRALPSNDLFAIAFGPQLSLTAPARQALASTLNRVEILHKRNEVLRENGYPANFEDNISSNESGQFFAPYAPHTVKNALQNNALPSTLTLHYHSNDPANYMSERSIYSELAKIIKRDWEKLGIKVALRPTNLHEKFRSLNTKEDLTNYQAVLVNIPEHILLSPEKYRAIFNISDAQDNPVDLVIRLRHIIPLYAETYWISYSPRVLADCQNDKLPAILRKTLFCSLLSN